MPAIPPLLRLRRGRSPISDAANEYFSSQSAPSDVVWTYSGVRPLYDDDDRASAAQEATRDYVLELNADGGAPLLSIFGGKITTYRRLAQLALEKLEPYLGAQSKAKRNWTAAAPLPGGDFPARGFDGLLADLGQAYPWIEPERVRRLARAYGTEARKLLGEARQVSDLGRDFGAGLTETETLYLMRHEWAQEAADVVWRRSKLGLRLSADQIAELEAFMAQQRSAQTTTLS
jgi:glycerol-3-phosphate dehydrogenase